MIKEASQTRDYWVAKSATLRAAPGSFGKQRTLAQADNPTLVLTAFLATICVLLNLTARLGSDFHSRTCVRYGE